MYSVGKLQILTLPCLISNTFAIIAQADIVYYAERDNNQVCGNNFLNILI